MHERRHFLIERYARSLWPFVRGQKPYVIRGRCFASGYRCAVAFDDLDGSDDSRWTIAEVLLGDWTLDAAYTPTNLTPHEQVELAVLRVYDELGSFEGSWSASVRWLLELTPTLEMWQHGHLSEDGIKLTPMDVV